MSYEAVIFDNDGVLVEEADWATLRDSTLQAFAAVGVDQPASADVESIVMGVSPETVHQVADRYGVNPDAFWRARDSAASDIQIKGVKHGAKQLFDDATVVRDLDVPLSVVSSNQQATVEFLLEYHGLIDAFVSVYGRRPVLGDLRRKKPNPYFMQRAFADLAPRVETADFEPADVLVVGDNATDVQAAHAAGMDGAYLRRNGASPLDEATPDHELASLSELPALLSA